MHINSKKSIIFQSETTSLTSFHKVNPFFFLLEVICCQRYLGDETEIINDFLASSSVDNHTRT